MNLFSVLLRLMTAALPLPVWTNKDAVDEWLDRVGPELVDAITEIFGRAKDGAVAIDLPDGQTIMLAGPNCCSLSPAELEEKLRAFGDGAIIAMLMKLIPVLIQILPLFLEPKPAPEPAPDPPAVL